MSKRNFWIFTDSSADMTEQYYAENGEPIFITHGSRFSIAVATEKLNNQHRQLQRRK